LWQKYAGVYNLSGSPETIIRRLSVLKEHCKDVGRDYGSILKTSLNHIVINDDSEMIEKHKQKVVQETNEMSKEVKKAQTIYGTSEEVLKQVSLHEEAGIQYFIVNLEPSRELDALELFCK
jgi:hypothetical protein